MSYTLSVGCPMCAGPLRHITSDGEMWADTIGATAVCPACTCKVTITVELSWKVPDRHGMRPKTKLALEPLMKAAGCATANQLGALIGLRRESVQRLKTDGVPIHRADELAVLCGLHAAAVWGDDFYQVLELQEAQLT